MIAMTKRIIFACSILTLFLFVYFLFGYKKIDEAKLQDFHDGHIKLNEITNFKWDYADLYVHNVDFQKIVFYKNNHVVFSETVQLDKYGDLVSQYLFTDERDDTLYYKCSFERGKLQFVGKEKLELSGGFLYFYKPIGCVPNQVNPLK